MSIRVMTLVWANSKHKGSTLILLLAIADFADDEGFAYPAVSTLAGKCRMSERNTRYALRALVDSGELLIKRGAGQRGANLYRVTVEKNLPLFEGPQVGAKIAPAKSAPAMGGTDGVQRASVGAAIAIAPEPSVNVIEPKGEALRAHATRLPHDWQLPKAWGDWAIEKHPTWTPQHVREVADNFRDHWIATAGQRGVKLDWFATWRTWVRREGAMKRGGGSPWYSSEPLIIATGKELGLSPRPGESIHDFKGRVEARLHAH